MNCHETKSLVGPYHDSELDVRTSQEIREHLAVCPDCRQVFATDEVFQRRLQGALKRGNRTVSLWERIESLVTAEGESQANVGRGRKVERGQARAGSWRWWFWPSPSYYAGLALVWMILLPLHYASLDPKNNRELEIITASAQVRTAISEQRRLLTELLKTDRPALPSAKSSLVPSRSERPTLERKV